jgi:hypothetical protein
LMGTILRGDHVTAANRIIMDGHVVSPSRSSLVGSKQLTREPSTLAGLGPPQVLTRVTP